MIKLTKREKQVLMLLANGMTNKEISARLLISESTAENHVHRIYNKICVSNRSQATAFAFQAGYIQPNRLESQD
jgi:DNA-binding NarL/FixJ family response regulator